MGSANNAVRVLSECRLGGSLGRRNFVTKTGSGSMRREVVRTRVGVLRRRVRRLGGPKCGEDSILGDVGRLGRGLRSRRCGWVSWEG